MVENKLESGVSSSGDSTPSHKSKTKKKDVPIEVWVGHVNVLIVLQLNIFIL